MVKINETTGERSIYLGSYAEVTYTGAAAATPTPSATLSPTASRTPLPSRTSTPVPTQTRTPTKTRTPTRTPTPVKTPTNPPTNTLTPSNTPTPTLTPTPTQSLTPTATPNPNLVGKTWKFYYLAGTERVAMRVITLWVVDTSGDHLYYLFTDHLGSTSEVRLANGTLHSRQYYRAFGEERYTSGALPTDRTYTGQREIENGLVHYRARIYDPYLNRWLSPDSIIPESSQGIQAWDRYAYVNNSPVKYSDPSGNFPWLPLLIAGTVAAYTYASSIGWLPDVIGIAKVYEAAGSNGVSIEVAAGLAVQGEYAGPIDDFVGDLSATDSGYGLAQVGSKELSARGLENADPHDPAVAIQVMQARIQEAQAACNDCNNFDMLVAAGLGQNGYIALDDISNAASGKDWMRILNNKTGDRNAQFRMFIDPSKKGFNAIVLQKYAKDLRALRWLGWDLPEGMNEAQFKEYLAEMEDLANER